MGASGERWGAIYSVARLEAGSMSCYGWPWAESTGYKKIGSLGGSLSVLGARARPGIYGTIVEVLPRTGKS